MPRATLLGRCVHDFFLPLPEYQVADLPGRWREFIHSGERQDECLIVSNGTTRRVTYHARANVLPGLHLLHRARCDRVASRRGGHAPG